METDGYERDPRNHTIFTCQFIVTTVITDVGLLGLHAEKSVSVHNYRHWRVLYVMNIEEDKVA